jgi:hypothetical protein
MKICYLLCCVLGAAFLNSGCLLLSTTNENADAVTQIWQKLPNALIAQVFFPDEKLYFEPTLEGLPMLDAASLDGVNVYEIKKIVANFDEDPEPEMAILIQYSTGMCTFCVGPVVFAILDQQSGRPTVAWKTESGEAFENAGETDISTLNLIANDKYHQLAIVFDRAPVETGSSHKKTRIIRWDGMKFNEIWQHDLVSRNGGNRGGVPHDYVANVEFIDDGKGSKIIKVVSLYATRPTREEERTQRALDEEFAWSERDRRFILVRKHEQRHEKSKICDFVTEPGRKDIIQCY